MTTPFGPQLIGETEKTLNAVLHHCLRDTGLTEPEWVTLRLAGQHGDLVDGHDGLTAVVADRAHFPDAAALVDALHRRGLLDEGRLSPAGRALVTEVQRRIAATTAPVWQDLPAADVAAATRLLNEVVGRARALLG
jgi:hypothetical protein